MEVDDPMGAVTGTTISDAEKRWVARLHAAGFGRNAIARETGLGLGTVSGLCELMGLTFDRSAVEAATRARKADLADRRARLVERLYEQAESELARLAAVTEGARSWDTVLGAGGGLEEERKLSFVPAPDQRATSHSISSYVSSATKLEAVDAGVAVEDGKSLLGALADKLGVRGPRDT